MNDILIGYSVTLASLCTLTGMYLAFKVFVKNKLLQAENKLRLRMQSFEAKYSDFKDHPEAVITGALGDIGIEGIMNELGIDPKLLNNPLVKGLIDKYAPKLIERLSKQGGEDNGQTTAKGFM